jgi:hypothetical protein
MQRLLQQQQSLPSRVPVQHTSTPSPPLASQVMGLPVRLCSCLQLLLHFLLLSLQVHI